MSILRTSRIENLDGSKGVDTGYVVDGSAKALLNMFNTTMNVNASLNVSSIVDVSGGQWDINFTSSFANADYLFTHGGDTSSGQRPEAGLDSLTCPTFVVQPLC